MQPNAPSPGPPPAPVPPANQSPYDFILQEPAKKPGFSFGDKKQLLMFASLALVVLVLVFIIGSVVTSSGKSTTETLVSLAQEETELARISEIGTKKARGADAKALAMTSYLAIVTTQQDTVALLKKEGHKMNAKKLALKKDTKVDQELTAADQNNTFDDAFTTYIQQALVGYQKDLKQAYDASISKNEKGILAGGYNGVNTILGDKVASGDKNVQPN